MLLKVCIYGCHYRSGNNLEWRKLSFIEESIERRNEQKRAIWTSHYVVLFKARFELGMFDPDDRCHTPRLPYNVVEINNIFSGHLERWLVRGMVLLKNKNNVLPLNKSIKKIAVVGPQCCRCTMLWTELQWIPNENCYNFRRESEIKFPG